MTKSKIQTGVAASVGMLILILDGKTAFSGAQQGVELCIRTVIPSLFPFFILSTMLTSTLVGCKFPISLRLFGIPKGAESIMLTGFLGGYPVGAQCIADAWRRGQLSKNEAERMLGFCNNAGPSFLFGIIAPLLPGIEHAWMLWGIHVVSALLVAVLLPSSDGHASLSPGPGITLTDALNRSIRILTSVCGWIILFRIVIAFLDRWILWVLPTNLRVATTGLLELSNGCCALLQIADVRDRFIICAGILAFGGLCVTMQTISVTQGLRLRYYFPGKLMQTAISVFLAWAIQYSSLAIHAVILIGMVLAVFHRKKQNNSSIPTPVGV